MRIAKYALVVMVCSVCLGAAAFEQGLALRNFREIGAAYGALLEVDMSAPDIQLAMQATADRLPVNGNVEEFSNPMVLAATELSGLFCQKAIAKERAQTPGLRKLFPAVNFNIGPKQFTTRMKRETLDMFADLFWQRLPTSAEVDALLTQFDESIAPNEMELAQATTNILQTWCVAYATSLDFLVKD